ncbi:hypothetical protein JCM8097_008938 [Rhodosporidiobolus ruineniae]
MRSVAALSALAFASTARAAVVEAWYNLTYVTASPDGYEKDYVVGVNGTWPPPILNVNQGDTVRVHAYNSLDGPSSLHHHGIYFNGSNYYDGAPGVTQCGIPTNNMLTYEIPVDEQFGTYWWHSHTGVHYQDGLRAPFVIHGTEEPHAASYDDEYTIIVSDWYHERATKLNNQFMNKFNPTGAEPIPDSLLIYAAQNGSYITGANGKPAFNDDLNLAFEPGKTYRLRVVNTGIFSMLYFWLDGHDMRVIEADGIAVEEYPVDYLTLSVAQRYSVLVTARNDTAENFNLQAIFDIGMFDSVPDGLVSNYTATISYGSGNPTAELGVQEELTLMTDHLMVPTEKVEQFDPTMDLELDVWFDAYDNGVNRASMYNNITYVSPDTPSLMTMLSMGNDSNEVGVYGKQTAAQLFPRGEVMNLLVINFDANAHPFHLHGHTFQITRLSTDVTSDDPTVNPPHTLGAANPMRRDTIIVPAGGAVNLAWRSDNPGAWIFHCHIQWHMEAGLAVVFMEDVDGAQKTLTLPDAIKDQCTDLGISYTGNAAGKMSTTDLSGAPSGPRDQAHITGWTPKAKGALAGCIITALLGFATVVWYAVGGQLDADELEEEVQREVAAKEAAGGGYKKRLFNKITGRRMAAVDVDTAHAAPAREAPDEPSLIAQLPRPKPVAIQVRNLTIQAPVPQVTIPLAIPIAVPRFVTHRLKKGGEAVSKELVRGVSLRVEPGEVLAIIGGSGSGKTTLLNVLARRTGNLELPVGGIDFLSAVSSPHPATPISPGSPSPALLTSRTAKRRIGYVRQTDDLLPYLTVRETLAFAAALRLPRTVSAEERGRIVEETILELGLADAADVVVGGAFRKGISGGERRRLSIGCVLVTLPSILVCDEPTTGLDAFTAHQLLSTLRRLAERGRTVLLSIHQPRSDAFPLFDKILLLSRGSVVYSGPRANLLSHFASLGYPSPAHANPLDHAVDVSSVDNRTDQAEEESSRRVGELVVAWREHEARLGGQQEKPSKRASSGTDVEKGSSISNDEVPPTESGGVARATLLQQTVLLTKRGLLNVSRNRGQTAGLFLQAVIIGVVLGLVFLNPPETPAGIQSLKTALYVCGPTMFYLSIIIGCWIWCGELVIFDREQEDGLYSTVPYVLSLFISYLPINVAFPALYAVIVYFMAHLRRDDLASNILQFIAHAVMQQHASFGYALFAASVNRSFAQASLLANGFSIPFYLASGYLLTHIPGYLRWTQYLSPYFYGYHWLARLQFDGRVFACDGITGTARTQCDGLNVLRSMRFNLATPLWVYPVGLLGFILVTHCLATLLLAFYHPGGIKHASAKEEKPNFPAVEDKDKSANIVDGKERETTAPRKKVDVVIKNLRLVVKKRKSLFKRGKDEKVILENVEAAFPAGQVHFVMGPSGAGKSSLLQLLTGRLSSSDFVSSGAILLNGQPFDSSLASLVAFVQQDDDHHLPALTVRETLRYAARLRLKDRSKAECDARAEEVLRMLGLKACADNIVGGELVKGISGGEKRRLSLAVELLSDPAVLFADEPLSGLDAFTAQNVMQSLKDLAASGRTIVATVHQPRSEIYATADNLLLLVKGGRTAYSGPASGVLKAFEAVGEKPPENYNIADWLLDVASIDQRSQSARDRTSQRVSRLVEAWDRRGSSSSPSSAPPAGPAAASTTRSSAAPTTNQALRPTSFSRALPTVLTRSFKNLRRQPDVFVARLANPPFLALLLWLYFLRLGFGPSSSQDRVGLLQETTALPFVGMLASLSIFPSERNLFFHEWKTSARHNATAFLVSYTLQETVVSLLSAFLWSVIFVFGMRLQYTPASVFPEFWISSFALISFGESVGIMFSAWVPNGGLAVSLVSAGLTLLAQLNGIISVSMDRWLEIIAWISPMKPQAYLTIMNEMRGLVFCSVDEVLSDTCIYETGEELLDTFGIPHSGSAKYMGILISLLVLYRLIAFLALEWRVRTL